MHMNQDKFVRAASDPASHLRLWITAGIGVAADLLSKWVAWGTLENAPDQRHDIIKGIFSFSLARNPGIAFGIELNWWLIMLATLGGIVLIGYLFMSSSKRSRAGHVGMGLILAGALGNLVDRVMPLHEVREFIDFHFWPPFNVADAMRCVIHVEDMAEVFRRVILTDKPKHETYNSGGATVSIGELAALVTEFLPDADIRFEQEEGGRATSGNFLIDNSRVVNEFGVQYAPLRQRVKEVINDIRRDEGLPLVD